MSEEDRGMNTMGMMMQGNNAAEEAEDKTCCEKEQIRREMADDIRSLEFAITELALYLDTHPEDKKALCLHKKYCKECKELKDEYQRIYGPLTIGYPCNKWRWLEQPWPAFKLGGKIIQL